MIVYCNLACQLLVKSVATDHFYHILNIFKEIVLLVCTSKLFIYIYKYECFLFQKKLCSQGEI